MNLLRDAKALARFHDFEQWPCGWTSEELACPDCGYEFVQVRPVGPRFPNECVRCGAWIAPPPMVPGDGLWIREYPIGENDERATGA